MQIREKKRIRSTHSSSSGSSLEAKKPPSFSFCDGSCLSWVEPTGCTEGGSALMRSMKIGLAGHKTGRSRETDLEGWKAAGECGACHSIICSPEKASTLTKTRPTTEKCRHEKSWWQMVFPYPETAVHNQLNTAVCFPIILENLCWNAIMFI